ncbi:MAG: peptidoglycan DD-metalloendopeptidase family protein [Acidobacteriota bacterium]
MRIGKGLLAGGIVVLSAGAFLSIRQDRSGLMSAGEGPGAEERPSAELPEVVPDKPPAPDVFEGVFAPDSTLQDVLFKFGFTSQQVHQLIQDTKSVYDLNRVRAGNKFIIRTLPSGRFQGFQYEISDEEYVRVEADGGRYVALREPYDFQLVVEEIYGALSGSLWDTLKSLGEEGRLVVDLAEILQWDVDFTAIQKGDWFKLVVEKRYREGRFVKYGHILTVQFNTGSRNFFGFLFQHPKTGKMQYYDENGNSLRKAFLKVPFHFSPRISSGFSYSRFHPILKKRRPHLGIDFAAPLGTRVLASANGTVVFAGWKGGFGKLVKIRHPVGFTTSYGHLSRILVKAGRKLQQGQVIGTVGATGLATGAHLDYRIQDKRGRYINPRKKISWPSDKPLDRRYWSEYTAVRQAFLEQLAAIPEAGHPAVRVAQAD